MSLAPSRSPANLASDQGNTGPEVNPASIPNAPYPQTHKPNNTPSPSATHSEAGEGVSSEEGRPKDADGEGTGDLEYAWLLGNNAFDELSWDTPGLYQF